MRKVIYKIWIPIPANEISCKSGEYKFFNGIFHCWGNAVIEFSDSACNYTIAIVENENGEIIEVVPENIKFVEPLNID